MKFTSVSALATLSHALPPPSPPLPIPEAAPKLAEWAKTHAQQQTAKKYLNGDIDDIEIESLRQVKELFIQFRNIYRNLIKDVKNNNYIEAAGSPELARV